MDQPRPSYRRGQSGLSTSWPAPCRGASAEQVGERAEDGGGRGALGVLRSWPLARADRQLLGGVCSSKPSAWVQRGAPGLRTSVCSHPGRQTGGVYAVVGYVNSGHKCQRSWNPGKHQGGPFWESREGSAVGRRLGRGHHVGLTLCRPPVCLPHRERQYVSFLHGTRGRTCWTRAHTSNVLSL